MKTQKHKTTIDNEIRLTLLKGAEAFAVSRETIRRALASENIRPGSDRRYSIRQLHAALSGDGRTSRSRLTLAKAKLAELELQEKNRNLLSAEETRRFIIDTFSPIREMIVTLPGKLAALVNPNDPAHARRHLEEYRDEFLKAARAHFPLPGPESQSTKRKTNHEK